jgi:hypothetical protein
MLKCLAVSVTHLPDNGDEDNLQNVGIPFLIDAFVRVGSLGYFIVMKAVNLGHSARLLIFGFLQYRSAVSPGIAGICWTGDFLVIDGKVFEPDSQHTHTHTHTTHIHARTHAHTHIHARTHTHHTYTHARTPHTHARARARHIHTHTTHTHHTHTHNVCRVFDCTIVGLGLEGRKKRHGKFNMYVCMYVSVSLAIWCMLTGVMIFCCL